MTACNYFGRDGPSACVCVLDFILWIGELRVCVGELVSAHEIE